VHQRAVGEDDIGADDGVKGQAVGVRAEAVATVDDVATDTNTVMRR
jgi:hypothetical protein